MNNWSDFIGWVKKLGDRFTTQMKPVNYCIPYEHKISQQKPGLQPPKKDK